MKIYIKSNHDDIPNLTDLFSYIDAIVVVQDARKFNMSSIAASVSEDNVIQNLSNMTDDEVHSIDDVDILEEINRVSPERLSDAQIDTLREYFYQKYTISKRDVNNIIAMLRECNEVNILAIKKNRSFMNKFTDMRARVLEIIHSLRSTDYLESTKNSNENGFGDELIVFIKKVRTEDPDGSGEIDIKIYIKIDLTQTLNDGGTIAIVSFHNAKTDEPVYPYVKYYLANQ